MHADQRAPGFSFHLIVWRSVGAELFAHGGQELPATVEFS